MMRKFSDSIEPVSIAIVTPKFYKGRTMPEFFPTSKMLWEFKNNSDETAFKARYTAEVLSRLDINEVQARFNNILRESGKADIALICYEKSGDFCHRHLLSEWLNNNGIECTEFKPE
jgi:uncharacterized protein YeaO (DUF488 family)